jgi:cytosine/adenosine deaminase-related metal-dependent hydrolase
MREGGMTAQREIHPRAFDAGELLLIPGQLMLPTGPVAGHAVTIAKGVFSEIGQADDLIAKYPQISPIELPGMLLMPGFIDVHHHLTQSFGKALAFGEPSEIFRRIWVPMEGVLDEEMVYLSSKLAALEALRGGFTTVVDAGTRAEGDTSAVARATQEAGLRCVLGLICNDIGRDAAAIMAAARQHLERWSDTEGVHPSLAISIPEVASDAMLKDVSSLCATSGAIFQTHVNEHLVAVERSLVDRGLRPIEHLYQVRALGPQVLLAHATLITPAELKMLRETDTAVAYNPVASAWKGNAVAPAVLMDSMGIRFGLGTDGTRGDGFRLIDAAETAQRLAFGLGIGDSSCGGGWTWLDHATAKGAGAIGLGGVTGRIAVGLAADCLLVDLETPEFTPSWDLSWELVRFGNRDQIAGVLVAGRLRLWQGWPVDWDGRALVRQVGAVAKETVARAPIKRVHLPSQQHRTAMTRTSSGSAQD